MKMKLYFMRGTAENGEFIVQNGWDWANDLDLTGPHSNENEIGTCQPLSSREWELNGYHQISRQEAEKLLYDVGFMDLSYEEGWFDE
jgi:hypothetical protein